MDALTLIVDRTTATLTGIPENWSPGIAPAKPPFLWNAPQGHWTQWGGYAYEPLSRNLGETMGVYLPIDLTSKTSGRRVVPVERRPSRTSAGGKPIGTAGAAKLARRRVW